MNALKLPILVGIESHFHAIILRARRRDTHSLLEVRACTHAAIARMWLGQRARLDNYQNSRPATVR